MLQRITDEARWYDYVLGVGVLLLILWGGPAEAAYSINKDQNTMELETNGLELDQKATATIAGQDIQVNIAGFAVFNDRPLVQVLVEWMDGNNKRQSNWEPVTKVVAGS